MRIIAAALALSAIVSGCVSVTETAPAEEATGVTRIVSPASTIPIASSVRVPAGHDLVFVSGMLPAVANAAAPANTRASYGDTETQTRSVLVRLEEALTAQGLTFADVAVARVFLVGDPEMGGRMDFAGLNRAFGEKFGTTAQPNRPARTAIQVVALPLPGALVEIDLIAAAR